MSGEKVVRFIFWKGEEFSEDFLEDVRFLNIFRFRFFILKVVFIGTLWEGSFV